MAPEPTQLGRKKREGGRGKALGGGKRQREERSSFVISFVPRPRRGKKGRKPNLVSAHNVGFWARQGEGKKKKKSLSSTSGAGVCPLLFPFPAPPAPPPFCILGGGGGEGGKRPFPMGGERLGRLFPWGWFGAHKRASPREKGSLGISCARILRHLGNRIRTKEKGKRWEKRIRLFRPFSSLLEGGKRKKPYAEEGGICCIISSPQWLFQEERGRREKKKKGGAGQGSRKTIFLFFGLFEFFPHGKGRRLQERKKEERKID